MVGTWVEEMNFVEVKDPGKKEFEAVQNWISTSKEMKDSMVHKSLGEGDEMWNQLVVSKRFLSIYKIKRI